MKIAIVIESFDPAAGGNERSTDQIARRLLGRGHEVTILTHRAAPDAALPAGGRIAARGGASPRGAWGLWRFARWAERRIDADGYDVSLSMTTAVRAAVLEPRSGAARHALRRRAAMRRGRLARALQRIELWASPKRLALLALERRAVRSGRVKRIVAISRYVADQFRDLYAVPADRIELIPNAAEISPMSADERARARRDLRRSLSIEDGRVAFLFLAMDPVRKGLEPLLRAMARLARPRPAAMLLVAGAHPWRYQALADRLGLAQRVRWLGPTRRTDALYVASDVTVLPTWDDPASKVVLESLLHGVPVISTRYNGASEWIASPSGRGVLPGAFAGSGGEPAAGDEEQPAGRVVRSPEDIGALAAAMAELCDDAERARCAAAARPVREHLTMDRHVDRLERLLRRVVE